MCIAIVSNESKRAVFNQIAVKPVSHKSIYKNYFSTAVFKREFIAFAQVIKGGGYIVSPAA